MSAGGRIGHEGWSDLDTPIVVVSFPIVTMGEV
jgi:hypothetical protein